MVEKIGGLPDFQAQNLRHSQDWLLNEKKALWMWIGCRLEYLMRRKAGDFEVRDPAGHQSLCLHSAQAKQISIFSNYLYRILQLLIGDPATGISGFEWVQKAAQDKRDFPFQNPRELLIEICREEANSTPANPEEASNGISLGDLRSTLRQQTALLSSRFSETAQEEEILQAYSQAGWGVFWIYGVFYHRHDRRMASYFKEFLAAQKEFTAFFCNPNPAPDLGLVSPKRDRRGDLRDPKTKQLLEY